VVERSHTAIGKRRIEMKGKTNNMKRRLSVVALATSLAAIAVPAASAGGGYQAGLVPTKLGSPDPRDTAQKLEAFSPSVVDRLLGSPDPRDSVASIVNEPSMDEVHLYDGSREFRNDGLPRADDGTFREIIQDAAQEHGAAGFGNATQAVRVLRTAPSVLAPDYSHLPTEDRPRS
jgi:hypothetical protein